MSPFLLEDELRAYQDMLQFKFLFIFQVLLEQGKLCKGKKKNQPQTRVHSVIYVVKGDKWGFKEKGIYN